MRPLVPLLPVLVVLAACEIRRSDSGRPPGVPSEADSLSGAERDSALRADVVATLRGYYAALAARDWRGVRDAFRPGAVVALRTRASGAAAGRVVELSVDEFLRRAEEGAGAVRAGPGAPRILRARVIGYGDLAQAWVVVEARSGRSRDTATTRGVDAVQLTRDGAWRISSLASMGELPGQPLAPPARRSAPRPAVPRGPLRRPARAGR